MEIDLTDMAPETNTRTRNKALRSRRIFQAAALIIVNDGMDKLRLAQVAKDAGVTVPTIHNLIGKKRDLFTAIAQHLYSKMLLLLDSVPSEAKIENVEGFLSLVADFYLSDETLYRAGYIIRDRLEQFDNNIADDAREQFRDLAVDFLTRPEVDGLLINEISPTFLARQMQDLFRLARIDWTTGLITSGEMKRQWLRSLYLTLAADATPSFKAVLNTKLGGLD